MKGAMLFFKIDFLNEILFLTDFSFFLERERKLESSVVPLIYAFIVESCMYPDQGLNTQSRCLGTML